LSLLAVLAVLIALVGLGQFSDAVDPARVPAWLWYYRQDPEVRRWLTVGVSVSALVGAVFVAAVLLARRRPLHGAARGASGSEQRRAGLRAHRGIVLGRTEGGFLIADGPEHVMLYAPTRTVIARAFAAEGLPPPEAGPDEDVVGA
jgi:type IV secretion system protein VirD4